MNRIYLDKLSEFTNNTFKNYSQFSKKIVLDDTIDYIKQNNSLNEKGIFNKYNFIELYSLLSENECNKFEYNEILLLCPICFNISDNINWYNLLNALLLILNNEYLHETNIKKKLILDITNNIYIKKINITNNLTHDFLNKVASLTNICIVIINIDNTKITSVQTHNNNNEIVKYIVLCKVNNNIVPCINWSTRFYDKNNHFIQYLLNLNINDVQVTNDLDTNIIKKKNKSIIKNNTQNINIKKNDDDDNKDSRKKIKDIKNSYAKDAYDTKDGKDGKDDRYEELVTNENYALYISEVTEMKDRKKKTTITSDSKKKSKKSKDIFILKDLKDEEKEKEKEKNNEDSIFKKTEILTKSKVEELVKTIKNTTTLSTLQEIAIKLNIIIVAGSNKNGTPKNKTRSELINDIQNKIKEYENK